MVEAGVKPAGSPTPSSKSNLPTSSSSPELIPCTEALTERAEHYFNLALQKAKQEVEDPERYVQLELKTIDKFRGMVEELIKQRVKLDRASQILEEWKKAREVNGEILDEQKLKDLECAAARVDLLSFMNEYDLTRFSKLLDAIIVRGYMAHTKPSQGSKLGIVVGAVGLALIAAPLIHKYLIPRLRR